MSIERDRWGRPLITPPGGGKRIPYTRTSTLAGTLNDQTALGDWKCRQTLIGAARRPDLIALTQAHADNTTELARITRQAQDAAGSDSAANTGTAIHAFTEQADKHGHTQHVPPEYRPLIDAYRQLLAGQNITVIGSERFCVQDEIETAGTWDRLVNTPDGLMIADIKTGRDAPKYALSTAIQVAVYAHSALYDHETGTRTPLPLNTATGILIHLPLDGRPPCLYRLNLTEGWMAALLAFDVRATRKIKPATPWTIETESKKEGNA